MQSAYDADRPNGSARRAQGDIVPMVFRLYRTAAPLDPVGGEGILADIQQGIRTVRNAVRTVQSWLSPLNHPLAGKILIREYRFCMILEVLESTPEVRAVVQKTVQPARVSLWLQERRTPRT